MPSDGPPHARTVLDLRRGRGTGVRGAARASERRKTLDEQKRATMDAAIRAYLSWYVETYEDVPEGLFDEVDTFLDTYSPEDEEEELVF